MWCIGLYICVLVLIQCNLMDIEDTVHSVAVYSILTMWYCLNSAKCIYLDFSTHHCAITTTLVPDHNSGAVNVVSDVRSGIRS